MEPAKPGPIQRAVVRTWFAGGLILIGSLAGAGQGRAATAPGPETRVVTVSRAAFLAWAQDYRGNRAAYLWDCDRAIVLGPLDLRRLSAEAQSTAASDSPFGVIGTLKYLGAITGADREGNGSAGTTPCAAAGTTPCAAAGTTPCAAAGTTPCAAAGTTPCAAAGTTPCASAGTTPCASAGTTPCASAGTTPCAAAGTTPAVNPGTVGDFLAFEPGGEVVTWSEVLPLIRDPVTLALLTVPPETQRDATQRIETLRDSASRRRALIGLLLADNRPLALKIARGGRSGEYGPPTDLDVAVPLLAGGLQAFALALTGAGAAPDAGPLAALAPAARAWLQNDLGAAESALFAGLLDAPLGAFAAAPAVKRPAGEAFGDTVYAQFDDPAAMLRRRAPGFAAWTAAILRTAAVETDARLLECRTGADGRETAWVFISANPPVVREAWGPGKVGNPPAFGAPVALALKTGPPGSERTGRFPRVVAMRAGNADRDGESVTTALLGRVASQADADPTRRGRAYGYLARAAARGWGGASWRAWHDAAARDASDRYTAWVGEVLAVNPDLATAREMERYLRNVAGRKAYSAIGSGGLKIAGAYLERREWDEARRWLSELPGLLRAAGESADGHGGPGAANRLAIESLNLVIARRSGRAIRLPADVDRRQAQAFLEGFSQDWRDESARREWQAAVAAAGVFR